MKCRWWLGTASGLSLGYNACGTLGNALLSVLKSITSLVGVPRLANSSAVRCSRIGSSSFCVAMASCMGKPSHMCATMAMLGTSSLVLMCGDGYVLVLVDCFPASLRLRLALCVSVVVSFLECGGGVVSAKLMASRREIDMTAWCGAAR